MKKDLHISKLNSAFNLVRPSSRAKKLNVIQDHLGTAYPVKFPLIRSAFPSRITVLKPEIPKISFPKPGQSRIRSSLDVFSSFLTNCFKSIIALAAIYVSIDFGCWNKTYLEPVKSDFQEAEAEEEKGPSEWEILANYIAGRA